VSKVAVCSRSFSRHPVLRAELEARHSSVTFNDDGLSMQGSELIAFLKGHEKIITSLERLDEALFTALPELKVVSKYGVGFDMVDLDAMARRGIKLGWTGGLNKRSVAELVIAFAIAALRHVAVCDREVRAGQWLRHVGRQLTGKTVGIIGCGHIGKDVAGLLKAFGCKVLANDIRDYAEFYQTHGVKPVDLETLLADADVVTLHVPLDETTRNILSAQRLALMKPDAILINAARGGLVDEAALKAMLADGLLAGAAFDVFACEPPDDAELLALPNFLATPHIGGNAEEAVLAMGRAAIEGLETARLPTVDWPAPPAP
jgi:phosphoglycerate dehydrogenase-like enzyme